MWAKSNIRMIGLGVWDCAGRDRKRRFLFTNGARVVWGLVKGLFAGMELRTRRHSPYGAI